jgi:hypothetical protein
MLSLTKKRKKIIMDTGLRKIRVWYEAHPRNGSSFENEYGSGCLLYVNKKIRKIK